MATKYSVGPIAECAERLEQLAAGESDLVELVQLTNELLELCRSTQKAYFNDVSKTGPKLVLDSAGEEGPLLACAE